MNNSAENFTSSKNSYSDRLKSLLFNPRLKSLIPSKNELIWCICTAMLILFFQALLNSIDYATLHDYGFRYIEFSKKFLTLDVYQREMIVNSTFLRLGFEYLSIPIYSSLVLLLVASCILRLMQLFVLWFLFKKFTENNLITSVMVIVFVFSNSIMGGDILVIQYFPTWGINMFSGFLVILGIFLAFHEFFLLSGLVLAVSCHFHLLISFSIFIYLFMGLIITRFIQKKGFIDLIRIGLPVAIAILPFLFNRVNISEQSDLSLKDWYDYIWRTEPEDAFMSVFMSNLALRWLAVVFGILAIGNEETQQEKYLKFGLIGAAIMTILVYTIECFFNHGIFFGKISEYLISINFHKGKVLIAILIVPFLILRIEKILNGYSGILLFVFGVTSLFTPRFSVAAIFSFLCATICFFRAYGIRVGFRWFPSFIMGFIMLYMQYQSERLALDIWYAGIIIVFTALFIGAYYFKILSIKVIIILGVLMNPVFESIIQNYRKPVSIFRDTTVKELAKINIEYESLFRLMIKRSGSITSFSFADESELNAFFSILKKISVRDWPMERMLIAPIYFVYLGPVVSLPQYLTFLDEVGVYSLAYARNYDFRLKVLFDGKGIAWFGQQVDKDCYNKDGCKGVQDLIIKMIEDFSLKDYEKIRKKTGIRYVLSRIDISGIEPVIVELPYRFYDLQYKRKP
ncbi:MAG: hypothetical protein HQK54_05420 [Oligoflexales bacterium]|nr:hypothetical protein [Oligoflexales bacterium]